MSYGGRSCYNTPKGAPHHTPRTAGHQVRICCKGSQPTTIGRLHTYCNTQSPEGRGGGGGGKGGMTMVVVVVVVVV